jgi:myo-inositol-1(or 4)-monophosphatase
LDLVTEADRESERAVIRTLSRAFPDLAILAEESGANARRSEHRWIIDPLDGITNFAHRFPQFCVSIAYEHSGRLELAVVYDALKRELFVAARGRGARLDGRPTHVSATPSLDHALLATALPYDQRERRNFYLTFWEAFMMRTQGVRHTGSAVLNLCYVACVPVDALWEFGLWPWEVAAGALIVTRVSLLSPLSRIGRSFCVRVLVLIGHCRHQFSHETRTGKAGAHHRSRARTLQAACTSARPLNEPSGRVPW